MSSSAPSLRRSLLALLASLVCWAALFGAVVFSVLGLAAFVAPDNWFADNMSFFLRQFLGLGLAGCATGLAGLWLPHRFPRLYRAAFALTVLVFAALAGLTGLRTLDNTARLEPARDGGKPIKIVSMNIERKFLGDKEVTSLLEREKPDIVVIQEAMWYLQKRRWNKLDLEVGSAGKNGFPGYLKVGASEDLVIYSRFPILKSASRIVKGKLHAGASVIHEADRELLHVVLDTGSDALHLIAVHPDSPRNPVRWENRRLYLEEADMLVQDIQDQGADPLVIIGDWNTAPWSSRFQDLLAGNNLKTAYPGGWPQTTRFFFDYRLHWILGAPVDQFAVSQNVTVQSVAVGPDIGSDHVPLIVDLDLPAQGKI